MSREEVLHREGGRLWPIAATLALGVVACLALAAAGRVDNAYGLAVGLACIWLAGIVPFFVGQRLYSTVTVTTRELRVGREAFPLAELDRELLESQLSDDYPGVKPRDSFSGSGPGVTMAGGSFGASLTDRAHLAFRRSDSDKVKAAPTRDPRHLAAVLLDAMGGGSSPVRS